VFSEFAGALAYFYFVYGCQIAFVVGEYCLGYFAQVGAYL